MSSFNWFDILLALIIVSSIFTGLRVGIARVVIGLIAAVIGFFVAFWNYRLLAEKLLTVIPSPTVANILAFLAILSGVLLVGALVGYVITRLLKIIGLSWLNHLAGALAGAVRGVLLAAVIVAAVVAFVPTPPPNFLAQSALLPFFWQASGYLADVAPKAVQDAYTAQVESLKRLWKPASHPEKEKEI